MPVLDTPTVVIVRQFIDALTFSCERLVITIVELLFLFLVLLLFLRKLRRMPFASVFRFEEVVHFPIIGFNFYLVAPVDELRRSSVIFDFLISRGGRLLRYGTSRVPDNIAHDVDGAAIVPGPCACDGRGTEQK